MVTVAEPLAKQVFVIAAVLGLMLAGSVSSARADKPEAIYFNAKIVTLDAAGSTAGAVAVKEGKILKVGSAEAIKQLAGPSTRLVDLADGSWIWSRRTMRIWGHRGRALVFNFAP